MTVQLIDNVVLIDGVEIHDVAVVAEFAAALEAGKDPAAHLDSLLSLGAHVASMGSNTAGAEKIDASILQARASIKDVAEALELQVRKQVTELSSEDGSLLKGLSSIVETFRAEVDEMTAGEDSPLRAAMLKSLTDAQTKIREDIANQVSRQKADIAALLDPSDPTSPLRTLADKIDLVGTAIAKVQDDIAKDVAVAVVIEASTVGGFDYEEVSVKAVQAIASRAGDDCEATGRVTGRVPRSKMGDGVVDLKVGATVYARIVLESKNKALSKPEWEREAEGSKANRAATGFIGMCKHIEDMPNGNRILVLDSQSIVVAFDPEEDDLQLLALVYQLVKIYTLSTTGRLDEINIAEVNKSLEDAIKGLEKFDLITKNAAAIRNSADTITKEANLIRGIITERLQSAQAAISRGIEPEALEPATQLALESHDELLALN